MTIKGRMVSSRFPLLSTTFLYYTNTLPLLYVYMTLFGLVLQLSCL